MLARRNFFNDFLSDPFDFGFFNDTTPKTTSASLMKTDIKETPEAYELDIDLPGFKKENVEIALDDGYLTINAHTEQKTEDKDENGSYLRKERSLVLAVVASMSAKTFLKRIFPLSLTMAF